MKNILGFLTIALIAITFVSCKKEYTCTCTITDSSGLIPATTVSETIEGKKKDAEDKCAQGSTTLGTIETVCELE